MYKDLKTEQRAHDLAIAATTLIYQRENRPLSSASDFFEFGCQYRSALKQIRNSLIEGETDLE